jgi:hypothetical protein
MSLRGHMEALFLLRAPRRVVLALQKGVFITVDSILTCLQPASNFVAKLSSYDSFFFLGMLYSINTANWPLNA